MNLEALNEIIKNQIEILESSATKHGVDGSVIIGIAKYAVANSYDQLSAPQKYHFDNCIKHLIQDVQCSGYTHELEPVHHECTNILDDDELVEYYQNDGKYCLSCEAQSSADAHSKESFFRD